MDTSCRMLPVHLYGIDDNLGVFPISLQWSLFGSSV